MKFLLVFVLAFQLLLTSMLGYAHLADGAHDGDESPHIHSDQAVFGSDDPSEEHDHTEHHTHLCYFVLSSLSTESIPYTPQALFSLDSQDVGIVHSPPVPPPTV